MYISTGIKLESFYAFNMFHNLSLHSLLSKPRPWSLGRYRVRCLSTTAQARATLCFEHEIIILWFKTTELEIVFSRLKPRGWEGYILSGKF